MERAIISAAVPREMPTIEKDVMKERKPDFLVYVKYRRVMKYLKDIR
ncbi:MAG: hypothetical protein IGBAC_0552 [Ignavibacteriae bacterium]|nr:MAG: hypothetical protein IGBAC_0552 [Ignavibacteriota bacterium]